LACLACIERRALLYAKRAFHFDCNVSCDFRQVLAQWRNGVSRSKFSTAAAQSDQTIAELQRTVETLTAELKAQAQQIQNLSARIDRLSE
jgi:hypothetical protein